MECEMCHHMMSSGVIITGFSSMLWYKDSYPRWKRFFRIGGEPVLDGEPVASAMCPKCDIYFLPQRGALCPYCRANLELGLLLKIVRGGILWSTGKVSKKWYGQCHEININLGNDFTVFRCEYCDYFAISNTSTLDNPLR